MNFYTNTTDDLTADQRKFYERMFDQMLLTPDQARQRLEGSWDTPQSWRDTQQNAEQRSILEELRDQWTGLLP